MLVLALLLRRMARIRGDEALGAAHAQWQLETFWLFLLLFLALLALFLGMGLIFNEGTALDRVEGIANAFSNGGLDIYETLARFWNIREIRWFTWAGLFWALLVLLWPLQRTVQGILALCARAHAARPFRRHALAGLRAGGPHAERFSGGGAGALNTGSGLFSPHPSHKGAPMPETARLILVLGMHRSGTSAWARALRVLGVDLGRAAFAPPVLPIPKVFLKMRISTPATGSCCGSWARTGATGRRLLPWSNAVWRAARPGRQLWPCCATNVRAARPTALRTRG